MPKKKLDIKPRGKNVPKNAPKARHHSERLSKLAKGEKIVKLVKDIPESQKPYHGIMAPKDSLKYPDGNPKTLFGITKPRATYTPPIPYLEYSKAHLQGALKYGPFNWRDDPVTMSTYLDAAESHIAKFRAGQDKARDTDIHELGHAMTCLSIIIDAQHYGTITDDRWRPRDATRHPDPAKVLDDYIENEQEHIKAIKAKWTNFQERFKAGEIDKNGNPLK